MGPAGFAILAQADPDEGDHDGIHGISTVKTSPDLLPAEQPYLVGKRHILPTDISLELVVVPRWHRIKVVRNWTQRPAAAHKCRGYDNDHADRHELVIEPSCRRRYHRSPCYLHLLRPDVGNGRGGSPPVSLRQVSIRSAP